MAFPAKADRTLLSQIWPSGRAESPSGRTAGASQTPSRGRRGPRRRPTRRLRGGGRSAPRDPRGGRLRRERDRAGAVSAGEFKPYVESSAINAAVDFGVSGLERARLFEHPRALPATSMHTVCELAATFLIPSKRARAMDLFAVVDELDPVYLPEPGELLAAEYQALRSGALVIPTPRWLDGFEMRLEVSGARGIEHDDREIGLHRREARAQRSLRGPGSAPPQEKPQHQGREPARRTRHRRPESSAGDARPAAPHRDGENGRS